MPLYDFHFQLHRKLLLLFLVVVPGAMNMVPLSSLQKFVALSGQLLKNSYTWYRIYDITICNDFVS